MATSHIRRHARRAKARAARASRDANEPNTLVTPKEAARRLECSVEAIYLSAKQRAFPNAQWKGTELMIPTDDIRALRTKDDRGTA